MSGHRQAALALHGIDAGDQRLILEQLGEQDRAILSGHLAELTELGFEPGLVVPVAGPARPPVEDATRQARAATPATPAGQLRAASAAAMAALLRHEPATLLSELLSAAAWPWQAAVLASLPPAKQTLVRAGMAAAQTRSLAQSEPRTPASARTAFLIDACLRRLAQNAQDGQGGQHQPAVAVTPAPAARNWYARLTAWTR